MNPIGLVIAAVGLFALAGGLRDWRWFWRNRRARTAILLGIYAAVAGA